MKNFKYRKKLVLFDLDGVLVDSKKNMQHSWDLTSKQFDLNVPFSRYFSFVGKPFKDILKSLRIKKNYKLIHSTFSSNSRKNFNELCYMSCALLKNKSSIYDQISGHLEHYSFEVFFRHFLIILIGFAPLFILASHSSCKEKDLVFFKNFRSHFYIKLVLKNFLQRYSGRRTIF